MGDFIPGMPFIAKFFAEETIIRTLEDAENEKKRFFRKFSIILFIYVLISIIAALVYFVFEDLSFLKASYYAFTTALGHEFFILQSEISLVIATIVLIGQWALIWLLFEMLVGFVAEGRLKEVMEGGHIKKKINKMKGHFIICGAGRVGTEIARTLKAARKNFVIIDKDVHTTKKMHDRSLIVLQGDCLQEKTLLEAGITKADTLIAAFGKDADNVFLTLTAKELNPKIRVITRAENPDSTRKLEQAGAEQVVLPSVIGGKAMADVALRHSLEFPGFTQKEK